MKLSQNSKIYLVSIPAFLGFLDAVYLTIKNYLGSLPPCSVISGCEFVLNSQYSHFLGIPLPVLGSVYYLTILVLLLLYLDLKNQKIINLFGLVVSGGFLFTLYLVFLMIFVIKAVCIYCLVSATSTTILFIIFLLRKKIFSN